VVWEKFINSALFGSFAFLALAFSRLIDDSVVVLENIFRYIEMGFAPRDAAERGGMEVSLAVLAATSTTSIVFFPVSFLSGISKYIFAPLALGVVLSISASYFFAMTVVPLYCANFIRLRDEQQNPEGRRQNLLVRFDRKFNEQFQRLLAWYEGLANRAMQRPGSTAAAILGGIALALCMLFPFLGRTYFPRTDPGQFVIDGRMPSGTRLEESDKYIAKVEAVIRSVVKPSDLDMVVSNIGVYPDLSAIYTTNASMDTAFVQTSLKEDHSVGSYEYIRRVQQRLSREMPELTTYFQAGGLVDGVIDQGLPAPIDIQIGSNDMPGAYALARTLAEKIKAMPNVSGVYIRQNLDYPALR
jgi:multidrug efflux pump subunit AcrB